MKDLTVIELFEKQARDNAEQIAVRNNGQEISYMEFNEYVNQLAHLLNTLGVMQGKIVNVMLPLSADQVASMLSIFKAGGIYLPMNRTFSDKRIIETIQKTCHGILIIHESEVDYLLEKLKDAGVTNAVLVVLGAEGDLRKIDVGRQTTVNDNLKNYNKTNPSFGITPEHECYIYFTSGSTGEAKAILGCHKSLYNYIQWVIREFDIKPAYRVGHLSQTTFDASLKDVFMALGSGATLCIPAEGTKDNIFRLLDWLQDERVSIIQTVPSLFRVMMKAMADRRDRAFSFADLKHIMLDGEVMYEKDVMQWRSLAGEGTELVNLYGTTESTILDTCHRIGEISGNPGQVIHVGKPVDNTHVLILNSNNKLCRIGETGEVYIKTPYLTRGYYNNDELTAAAFVQNPLVTDKVDIVYRTGDLGRYLKDRNVEILGRKDKQVKINGIRIEINEIEKAVLNTPGIQDVAIVVHTNKENNLSDLICYFLAGTTLSTNGLKAELAKSINANILPAYFIQLKAFPLNSNGKLDKKALPLPQDLLVDGSYEACHDELEIALESIWKEVLGRTNIGRNAMFMAIGGQSLKAIQVVSRIYQVFQVNVTIRDVFEFQTIREFANHIRSLKRSTVREIMPIEEQDFYQASDAQKRLWILAQTREGNIAYNIGGAFSLQGYFDIDKFDKAIGALVKRHESLRTAIFERHGELCQRVLSGEPDPVELIDLSKLHNKYEAAKKYANDLATTPFDLDRGSLIRMKVIRLEKDEHLLVFTMHHIISDAWSMRVLIRELLTSYNALTRGKSLNAQPLRVQYKDYMAWQNGQQHDDDKIYWIENLSGNLQRLDLPLDFPRPAVKSYNGKRFTVDFSAELYQQIETFCLNHEITLFTFLIAALNTLFYRYTSLKDIILGTTIAGRDQRDLEDQIGFYVNTLALRTRLSDGETFLSLVSKVKETLLSAHEHKAYPFENLVEDLRYTRDPSHSPLFDTLVELINVDFEMGSTPDMTAVSVRNQELEHVVSKFDLTLSFKQTAALSLNIEFNSDLFKKETVVLMCAHMQNIMHSVVSKPDRSLHEFNYLNAGEIQNLLVDIPVTMPPPNELFIKTFERVCKQHGEAVAVQVKDKTCTYAELNDKANKLARYLIQEYDVKADDTIAIMSDRTIEMVAGMIGILKSGAAFVPIDPEYPAERIKRILKAVKPKTLLIDSYRLLDVAAIYDGNLFTLDLQLSELDTTDGNLSLSYSATANAYVIFTSGSTGTPKGVVVSHDNLMNYLTWANRYYFPEGSAYTFGLFTSLAFDLSITALFTTLLRGDKLVLFPGNDIDQVLQLAFEGKFDINTLKITPSHITMLRELSLRVLPIKKLIVGGEVLKTEHLEILEGLGFTGDLYNEYGPTETTVGCTVKHVRDMKEVRSIGKPIANTHVLILDHNLALLPQGYIGELCVGGACVSKGYSNDASLTREKFVQISIEGKRTKVYRTGDLGRWMHNGEIEYLGRKDDQVKLRGHRIEPIEIETYLGTHPNVDSAKVKLCTDGDNEFLVAYYIGREDGDFSDLRSFMAGGLPAYMVPSCFVRLNSFPYTLNGKVDMEALPSPKPEDFGVVFVPADNAVEQEILNIWEEILCRKQIGVLDNFFDLGGHSLKATQIASQVRKRLKVDLHLKDIFAHPTVRGMANILSALYPDLDKPLTAVEDQDYYNTSHAQGRMWILHQLEEQKVAYNIPGRYKLKGDLSIDLLNEAFAILIDRHESLRTSFITQGGKPMQRIHDAGQVYLDIKVEDISDLKGKSKAVGDMARREAMIPFDLEKAPLMRLQLVKTSDQEHVLLFNIHHIISDGWSMEILIKEFLLIYNSLKKKEKVELPPLKFQYKEFSSWQNSILEADHSSEARQFWMDSFKGEVPVLNLPVDFQRPAVKTFHGGYVNTALGGKLTEELKAVARKHDVSLFILSMALVKSFLYKYTNQSEIVVGTPVAGRDHADLENQVGLFVNTLALATHFDPAAPFTDLLKRVEKNTLQAFDHQQYPFDRLVEDLDLIRDMSRSPLFDVFLVVNYANSAHHQSGALADVEVGGFDLETAISKFDLQFTFNILEKDISISLGYNSDIFKKQRAEAMLAHFRELVKSIVRESHLPVKNLTILTPQEKEQLLITFNNTASTFDPESSVIKLFEDQVRQKPKAIALVHNERSFTYENINRDANQLANYLIHVKGVKPGDFVGLITGRTPSLLIGLLGILKAGAAYVTFDPEYPADRISYILQDTNLNVVIAENQTLADWLSHEEKDIILLDVIGQEIKNTSDANPGIVLSPAAPAYIIYTSGSTGRPKGVVIAHESVSAFLDWASVEFGKSKFDIVYATTSYCFDLSVFELFYPLTIGKTVRILENGLAIPQFVNSEDRILLNTVPSVVKVLIEEKMDFGRVQVLNMAGEPIPLSVKTTLEKKIPEIRNLYGPSEDTTYSTCYRFKEEDAKISIGKPISNTRVYVLNDELDLLPVGVPGELCIAGLGLAKGYLNQIELTSEKFVANPFNKEEYLYKTGDFAQWMPDGQLDFLGRRDNQVKVRGYRIELGEVETAIGKHPAISDALVSVNENAQGTKHLVAYFIGKSPIEKRDLVAYLSDKLPAYMIPQYLIGLDEFPLTPNGKIDRKRLPDPFAADEGSTIVPASNAMEQALIDIWKDVLDHNNIGIYDNFFTVGGDSIKALQIAARAHERGFKLEVRNILKSPTIAKLALMLKPLVEKEQQETTGTFPLTPIQREFFADQESNVNHYNQAVMFFSDKGFDRNAVDKTFVQLILHHDALRGRYKITGNGIVPEIISADQAQGSDFFEQGKENKASFIESKTAWAQQSLNVAIGPIMRVVLLRCEDGDRLLIVIHHLAVDGVSWRILLEDFRTLYDAFLKGDSFKALPPKTTSFRQWSNKLTTFANSKAFAKEASYWTMATTTTQTIPADRDDETNLVKDARTSTFWLDEFYTDRLLRKVNQAYNTEVTDILLSAIGMGIREAFGLDAVSIAMEGHGRENILEDVEISRTVGWFTCIYPVNLNLAHTHNLARHVKEVKEQSRKIPNKGIGYGIWKHLLNRNEPHELSQSQEPPILFNYLGQFDADIKRSGLAMASESVGDTVDGDRKRKHLLEINSATVEGKLQLSIVYSHQQFNESTIANLLEKIKVALTAILDWCASREKPELTPADLTFSDLTIDELARIAEQYPVEDIYPLSPMQEGLFFHILMDKNSSYFEQLSYTLQGDLNVDIVQRSLNELFKRHDILRAGIYQEESGNPLQLIIKDRKIDFYFEDLADKNTQDQQSRLATFKAGDKARSFDLLKDTLLRVAIIKLGDQLFECIWSYHHILLDGWCMSVLFPEYFEIYSSLSKNIPYRLPEVKPYKKYIEWLGKRDSEASKKYWHEYLKGYQEKASIPSVTNTRRAKNEYAQDELFFEIPAHKTEQLKKLAQTHQVTINTVFHALWGILLSKYSGKKDVVFGEVVSGRPAEVEGIEKMIGLFINTIPIRVSFDGRTSFVELLSAIHHSSVEREPHHYSPLVDIQAVSVLKNDLFDHILMLGNYPVFAPVDENDRRNEEQGMSVSNVKIFEQVSYDLNLGIGIGEKILMKFNFNEYVYDKNFLRRLSGHFELLIDQILHESNIAIADLDLISREERHEYLVALNDTKRLSEELERPIHAAFERQVKATPKAIALKFKGQSWTYETLNAKANTLAHYLKDTYSLQPDDRIGLLVDRSELMIIGILAILKAGAAYVPVDPGYPVERIVMILKDAGVKALVTESNVMFDVGNVFGGELFAMDIQLDALEPRTSNLPATVGVENLAYIMYTSGSSGKPKGVAVEHKGVVRLVKDTNYTNLNSHHQVLQLSNFAFDGSVFDIFGSLLNGCCLHLIGKDLVLSNEKLIAYINEQGINVTFITTALFNNMVELSPECIGNFDHIYFGGEEASLSHIRKALEHRKHKDSIVHVYGPTESTTFSTYHVIDALPEYQISVPIGKPISNTTAYILDENLKPVPAGVIGEIYLGGTGLARGYWMNESMTAQKFITHSFDGKEKIRLYRTGDLGRFLPGGSIDFKGRKDNQVKIRGHRVELGEIENIMLRHDDIDQAHLVIKDIPKVGKQLVAYYTGNVTDLKEFRSFMERYLPAVMIPSSFIKLESMPFNANGKIDNHALPDPGQGLNKSDHYTAPRTDFEKTLVRIWESILKKTPIGIKDNFFMAGGDSILAIRLVSTLNKELHLDIEVKDIFHCQDIMNLAQEFEGKGLNSATANRNAGKIAIENLKTKILGDERLSSLLPEDWEDFFPASDIQKGMLYYSTALSEDALGMYHDQIFYQFEDRSFDYKAFEEAFYKLVQKHEILRTSFDFENFPEEIQIVHTCDACDNDIDLINISHLSDKQKKKYLAGYFKSDRKNPFTITKPGLWRLRLFQLSENDFGVLFVIHHAIIDGWSEASLRTELSNIYYALKEGKAVKVQKLKASYKDFVIAQLQYKGSEQYASFWKAQLKDYQRSSLPLNKKIGSEVQQYETEQAFFPVPSRITDALLHLSEKLNVPIKSIFVTAFAYFVKITTGKNDVTFGLVSNSRPEVEDGDKIIGCFLNTVPFRLVMKHLENAGSLIDRANARAMELKEFDKLPLLEIATTIGEATTGGNPIFDLIFNYLDLHITGDMHQNAQGKKAIVPSYVKTNTHFDFTVNRVDNVFHLHLIYESQLFNAEDVKRVFDYYTAILESFAKEKKLAAGTIIPAAEKNSLMHKFNDVKSQYPSDKGISALFAEVAKQLPQQKALVFGNQSVTYAELDEMSTRLANYLLTNEGIMQGDMVGIKLRKSIHYIVSMLGIVKSGATYVPLPGGNNDRLNYIIEDVAPRVLLMDSADKSELCNYNGVVLRSDRIAGILDGKVQADAANLPTNKPSDVAYIMYTSGSTGRPKGVVVEHRGVVRLVKNTNYVPLSLENRLLQNGSIAFDASTFEIWGMLLNGGTLHLAEEEEMMETRKFKTLLYQYKINVLWITTAWFHQIVEEDIATFMHLDHILVGGERLSKKHMLEFKEHYPYIRICNMYGPTENTTFSTFHEMENIPGGEETIPIGKPISNSTLYIMDGDRELVPVGVVGEIMVGGDGLARGYWKNESLTAAKFIANPLNPAEKLYCSGDYGRWLKDGTVEFLGRVDNQVKVRGFRIELGEIETVMEKIAEIEKAIVVAVDGVDMTKQLVAYYSLAKDIEQDVLRRALKKQLPDYMVPASLIRVYEFPLNVNGKVDRQKLLSLTNEDDAKTYTAPRNDIEKQLAEIWQAVLGLERISIDDNFFEIGGHSLTATRMLTKVHKEMDAEINLRQLFISPTLEKLASEITATRWGMKSMKNENEVEYKDIII
ncbi:MAG: amino acid adenylation domain-containing protein [Bacteroidota bacterium]